MAKGKAEFVPVSYEDVKTTMDKPTWDILNKIGLKRAPEGTAISDDISKKADKIRKEWSDQYGADWENKPLWELIFEVE